MVDALTDISLNKLPPYNKEAEQSVLGACLHSEDAIAKALGKYAGIEGHALKTMRRNKFLEMGRHGLS